MCTAVDEQFGCLVVVHLPVRRRVRVARTLGAACWILGFGVCQGEDWFLVLFHLAAAWGSAVVLYLLAAQEN